MDNNSKRIAKNTFYLYLRSAFVLLVSLYTSRVVLNALGVEDFGLYNVIGGVVALFSFMRTSLTKSTQRFLNAEMAKGNDNLNNYFITSVNIHLVISVVAFVLLETVGLWLLNTKIQIPEGREFAAMVVYQTTTVSLLLTIISTPYNAAIIAHEDMSYFAVTSIINAILKLMIAYILLISSGDLLNLYSVLLLFTSVVDFMLYYLYCRHKYIETKFRLFHSTKLTREMLGYTTWTILGQVAIVGTNQGNSIIVNMFHSVTANAAMGVASQVNSAVVTLTNNFQTAFNPQITKAYTLKDNEYLIKLINYTSKFSYIILMLASLPIAFNIDVILQIWLGIVPDYTEIFCVLILCNSMLNALSAPLNFTVLSSKNIKWFQIVTSIVYLLDLPIVYLAFTMGCNPTAALVVKVLIMVAVLFVRLYYCCQHVEGLRVMSFTKNVILRLFVATALSCCIGFVMFCRVDGIGSRIIVTCILVIVSILASYYVGMCRFERDMINNFIKNKIRK